MMQIGHTTSFETFAHLARKHRVVPVVRKILADGETPLSAFNKLCGSREGTFLLESAEYGSSWSRWSFIGVNCPSGITSVNGETSWMGERPEGIHLNSDPLDMLNSVVSRLATKPIEGLPPLASGLVGFLGYDVVRRVEDLPDTTDGDLPVPEMMMLLATDLAAMDHHEGSITLVANAVNWNGTSDGLEQAYEDSVSRLDAMVEKLLQPTSSSIAVFEQPEPSFVRQMPAGEYTHKVRQIIEEIYAGESFQVVLSQRFEMACTASAQAVYRVLRATNPSPYMYLLNMPASDEHPEFSIVGSSPEALVTVSDSHATTHPIAGTRWRGETAEEDELLAKELAHDTKEQAEHLMLVDLGRNDLGRVCKPGSVTVSDFSHIEKYSHVMHLVSTVTGEVDPRHTALDVIMACFPAGTLSGAPKPRAMEIIEELEPTKRGLYGGTVGYIDFAGGADMAIAIRTALLSGQTAYVQAGAGVVADSIPENEDDECVNKAMAVLRAVAAAHTLSPSGPPA